MATNFPNGLDNFPNPTGTTVLNQPGLSHAEQHANANDAIEALESKLGIDLSTSTNTIDYIVRLFLLTCTQHPAGTYAEYERVSGKVFPWRITWYTDSTKTIKLVEKEFTYGTNKPVPTTITMRLYNGTVANTVVRTITDTISYNQIFEVSRTRVVT
jgi:hypothetical protein